MLQNAQTIRAEATRWLGHWHPLLRQIGLTEGIAGPDNSALNGHGVPLTDSQSLVGFLTQYKQEILIPSELPAISCAYTLTSRNQFRELVDLDQRLADEPWLTEFSTSSRDAGRSHLERLRPLRDQRLVRRYGDAVTADEAHGWHVLVVGMALSLYSIPLRQGLMDYALHTLCSTVGQATRSMPLTQPETHEVLDAVTADLSAKVQSLVQPLPLIGV